MINETMLRLGTNKSVIRDLFEYGLRQAAIVGKENVYDFSIGNPSVPAPDALNAALRDLTHEDSLSVHGYTPASGCNEAKEAVAKDLTDRFGMEIAPSDLFFTCGAAPALVSALEALYVDGAEAIAVAPFFPEYTVFAQMAGYKFVVVPANEETFQLSVEALEKCITPNTQVVVINSPNNPSGVVYSRSTLEAVAELLSRKSREIGHPIYLIADEPYRELVYDGIEVPFVPSIYPNTIICYSYSKSLSVPGDRIGYVCVPSCVEDHDLLYAAVAGAARARGHVCSPAILQKAIARCTALRPNIEVYDTNRKLLYEKLTALGYECVKPQGAFYMFVKAPGGDAYAFSQHAKTFNLLVVPGADFGCPGFMRLCTCVSTDMIYRSLPAFEAAIASFQK